MLASSRRRILERLTDSEVVLDVGGWAKPFPRADWVLDLLPYETRGLYGYDRESDAEEERFGADTWVQRDICDHSPWPFSDDQFDFAVCSHTLEDVRDPVWVCRELQRVARAGYIEVPSRLEEQSYGIQGPWVGWGHHHWLTEIAGGRVQFVFKHHILHGRESFRLPRAFWAALSPEERVESLWWEGAFEVGERVFVDPDELEGYLERLVDEQRGRFPRTGRGKLLGRLRPD
ncbi:MAG: methyltransferase domain-containing protein [Thermoleophilaceae bacterium]